MGKVTGFLEFERLEEGYEPVEKRLNVTAEKERFQSGAPPATLALWGVWQNMQICLPASEPGSAR